MKAGVIVKAGLIVRIREHREQFENKLSVKLRNLL
jgi:hypothetical protein